MALKFNYKSREEVPAETLGLYVERDGAWLLDVDGAVVKAKLEEFRATNVALMKERDELKQRFEGIDPDEVRKLADEKRKLEEAQQLKASEVEKAIEARLRAVKGHEGEGILTFAEANRKCGICSCDPNQHLATVNCGLWRCGP